MNIEQFLSRPGALNGRLHNSKFQTRELTDLVVRQHRPLLICNLLVHPAQELSAAQKLPTLLVSSSGLIKLRSSLTDFHLKVHTTLYIKKTAALLLTL